MKAVLLFKKSQIQEDEEEKEKMSIKSQE